MQNEVDACGSYWVAQLGMDRKENITVSASPMLAGAKTAVDFPIYSVSHDGRNCQLSFNAAYLFTPQLLPVGGHDGLKGQYNYDVASTENLKVFV